MNQIDKLMKEHEMKVKKEIELIHKETEIILRQLKEKSKRDLKELDLQNKNELMQLEREYQNRIIADSNRINQIIDNFRNDVNRFYNGN